MSVATSKNAVTITNGLINFLLCGSERQLDHANGAHYGYPMQKQRKASSNRRNGFSIKKLGSRTQMPKFALEAYK